MARKKAAATKKQIPKKKDPKANAAPSPPRAASHHGDAIGDMQLTMTAELGRTHETIDAVTRLGDQSLIEFDKRVGEPIDVLLNGKVFARGEVVTVGENFGVRVTEIVERPEG